MPKRPKRKASDEIASGDLETDPFKEGRLEINPFVAGFFDGKVKEIWWGPDCIQKFIKRLKRFRGICYFHAGGTFDFHHLLEFLPVDDCEFFVMGKRIVEIKTPWGAILRDSFAIIPKAMAAFNKTKFDYTKLEANVREKYKAEIIAYLKDDLQNGRDMVVGFLKRFPMSLTLASSVFKLMRNEFDYNPGRSEHEYDAKFRPFFFGGRVSFWKLGFVPGKFYVVDINSAYPWAMTRDHWFGFECDVMGKIPKKHKEQSMYLVECHANACFPERQKSGGIDFPVKRGRFYVTGWELFAAKELKLIRDLKIISVWVPKRIGSMRKFAETLYSRKLAAKKAGDKEEEFFNKIAVNAGYGKLALNPQKFTEVQVTTIYDKPPQWASKAEKKAWPEKPDWSLCWDDPDRGLSFWKRNSYRVGLDKFVNVATAASITGCVRAFLLRAIHASGGAIYCDTDSLILPNISKLKMGEQLGEWKLELTIDSKKFGECEVKGKKVRQQSGVWIAGKKLYAAFGQDENGKWKWKDASKGVKLSPQRVINVALGKKETKVFEAPTYSPYSKPKFVTREVRRADQRKQK